jgi:hypothetical protein
MVIGHNEQSVAFKNVRDWQIRGNLDAKRQEIFQDLIPPRAPLLRFARYLQTNHSAQIVARYVTQTPEAFAGEILLFLCR